MSKAFPRVQRGRLANGQLGANHSPEPTFAAALTWRMSSDEALNGSDESGRSRSCTEDAAELRMAGSAGFASRKWYAGQSGLLAGR